MNSGANSELESLYHSEGLFCTQREAERARRVTDYPDRPDVMAPFDVRMANELAVPLSNGSLVAEGSGCAGPGCSAISGGRCFSERHGFAFLGQDNCME